MATSKQNARTDLHRAHLWRGAWLALVLSLVFLACSALQPVVAVMFQLHSNSVMTAASGAIWLGRIGQEVMYFIAALLILHVAFGLVAWGVAWATTVVWPSTKVRFGLVVAGWFCLLTAAVIAYSVTWYPRTLLGAYYHDAAMLPVGRLVLGQVAYFGAIAAAIVALLGAAATVIRHTGLRGLRTPLAVSAAVLAVALVSAFAIARHDPASAIARAERPHVILLGVDSLRLDYLRRFGGTDVTKNLDRFLAEADVVRDTTTPVARTFSSWTAILTGRSPQITGARFNLADRQAVQANPTLGDVLRDTGYRIIYSTDEVRFANFDESYGFDQVITPRIGAIDFIIGTHNQLPLVTVIANTLFGRWLFPYSYANRGAAVLYQPETYLARLERELSFEHGPTLFIAHLTASHWPYHVGDTPFMPAVKKSSLERPIYRAGVQTADEMFGELVAMLERKGALDNAIVVVLSDHGEALELPGDWMLGKEPQVEGLRAPLAVSDFGHGQSVLSPVQYQLLLGFRSFGPSAGFKAGGRDLAGGATAEDVAPTLLDLLQLPGDPLSATGLSFAPLLRGAAGVTRVGSAERVRFTETDIRVLPRTDGGGVDETATARHNAQFIEVDGQSGRMHVRQSFVPLVLAQKERAAFTDKLFLAALPAGPDAHQYLMLDRATGSGRLVLGPSDLKTLEEQRLFGAMVRHFSGELRTAVSVTPEDLMRNALAWQQFFVTRAERARAAATWNQSDGEPSGT